MRPFKPYTCRGKTPRNAFSLEGLRAVGFIPGRLDPQDTPEDNAHKIAKLKIVLREIIKNELTDIQKEIVLDCLTGKTQREIAEERGIHESTVSRHRAKAMKTLNRFGRYISPFLR